MKQFFIITFIILIGNNLTAQTKKELKKLQKIEDYQNNKTIVESGEYFFKATLITPLNHRTFNILDDNGVLIIKEKMMKADIPHISKDSIRTRVISHNEILEYNVEYKEKKKKIIVSFTTKGEGENLDILLKISDDNKADLYLSSERIDPISYSGTISYMK
ncbi:DUF4251 domain-containing protein [Formosa maritima]|uniref:DUF4251 domain-containing protein n=1 Tax=Formosa maritima TaxID=2592046 RepID=A0A5D0GQV4_9FLAO|nr:DUF4251 domain-containing protein [Formosa maritima]TYA60087.1 DUF4251 domain-containing protein [Formosa maritima]